jgi:CHASE2 domain-containing sensor protein
MTKITHQEEIGQEKSSQENTRQGKLWGGVTGRKYLEAFISLIISFSLAVLLVIKYDPIGLDASSKAHAEGVFYRIVGASENLTKWLYQSPEHGSDFGQNNTAMVLVDNKDLDVTGSNWPVPFELHNHAISSILSYKPKAIFVDISFTDARNDSSLKAFADTVRRAHADNIPIYFASLDPFNQQRKILPELAQACAKVIPAYRDNASVNGVEHGYLLKHSSPNGSSITAYEKDCGFSGQALIDSPALALYREYLRTQGKKLDDMKFEQPMEVFWATGDVHKVTARLMSCERKTFSNTSFGVWDIFTGNTFADIKQGCPHTPTVNVRDLFAAPANDAEAEEMFSGTLVIYAANITGSGDVIVSPTHEGRVPAAYLHAMALDNLLVLGDGYKKVSDEWEYLLLAILFIVFGFLTILKGADSPDSHEQKEYEFNVWPSKCCQFCWAMIKSVNGYLKAKGKKFGKSILINLLLVLPIILFICFLSFYYGGVAPLNWIKFIGFAIAYEVIESRMENAQHIHHFFNWLARLIEENNTEVTK